MSHVPAATRALRLLRFLAARPGPVSAAVIAGELGLPRSSVYQLLEAMTAVCADFREAGFVIEELLEPRPVPEMAHRYPEDHAQLERLPAFIAFRLLPV